MAELVGREEDVEHVVTITDAGAFAACDLLVEAFVERPPGRPGTFTCTPRERVRRLLGEWAVDVRGRGGEPLADVVGVEILAEQHPDHDAPHRGLDPRREVDDFVKGELVDHSVVLGQHETAPGLEPPERERGLYERSATRVVVAVADEHGGRAYEHPERHAEHPVSY